VSRLHPFDLVFGEMAPERFGQIRAAITNERRSRLEFEQLDAVQRLLADLAPHDVPNRAAVAEELGALLFAAYYYWDGGQRTCGVSLEQLDAALPQVPDGPAEVPGGACYVALPERRFWAQVAPEAPHEPIDGFFIVAGEHGRELTIVAVLGLRPERGGFSQVTITAPLADMTRAARVQRHPPFAPIMAGGDRAGFRSVVTEGELLHLAHLALLAAAG
jgi:hypothetical protein